MSLLSIVRPSDERVSRVVAAQQDEALTYPMVGSTKGVLPEGWNWDHQRTELGYGEATYRRAVSALRSWTQFDLDWVWPVQRDVELREGAIFAFVARSLGVWSINVCRVVYLLDEQDPSDARFGFAYGTVGAHSVRGEEQFIVHWDRLTDEVTFEIRKFSLPGNMLLSLLGPVTRSVQNRFTVDAMQRMFTEVNP
jgi:uncharacterized protein (UPF0548 family)